MIRLSWCAIFFPGKCMTYKNTSMWLFLVSQMSTDWHEFWFLHINITSLNIALWYP